MINILFIHQSAELYGSDKTLLLLLQNIDKSRFNSIVILPFDGPLKVELEKENIKVVIAPVLKLYRKMFSVKNIFQFLREIKKSFKTLDNLNKEYQFQFIYSNTLAVSLGILYAQKRKIKHIWHIHEIIDSPNIITKLFCKLIECKANTKCVFNSNATMEFWNRSSKITNKSQVILNGLDVPIHRFSAQQMEAFRYKSFNATSSEVVIALVGRISRWKGQKLLLNVFYHLAKVNDNIKLIFVGSTPPNQECFLNELKVNIEELNLSDKVVILPFQAQIDVIWQCVDIAVVPSTEPEPFGLVAVEAMLFNKPVIAFDHGGLSEIVAHNETGFLVEPNNKEELGLALQKLINNLELRTVFGKNGYLRACKEFSSIKYIDQLETIFIEL
jgi:glycosyltransferase involved in cell wall biosynthesis